jgi:hypothetical protein
MLRLTERNKCTEVKMSKHRYGGEGREGKEDKYGYRLARQPHSAPGAFFLCIDAKKYS